MAAQGSLLSEPTPRIQCHKERFGSIQLSDSCPIEQLSQKVADLASVTDYVEDSIITDNKLERINTLYS